MTVECIVSDLSEKGAKLDVPGAVTLPTEFTLEIPRKAMFMQVRVNWRREQVFGVEFVD